MADDTTTQTAAPDDQTQALVNQILQRTLTGQTQEPEHSGDNRTWGSLLGQALVGGAGPGSTDAANEQAGLRGLMSVGLGMMSGSDYSRAKHSLGSIVADAIGGAQQGNYEQQTAMLAYQKQQQEMQLERVKTALPLLTLQQQLQSAAVARKLAGGGVPTTAGANTSIANVGAVSPGALAPNEMPVNAAGDSATRKAAEGGPPAPGTPAAANAQAVHDFWISKGFSEPAVAGIMAGGPGSESNFDPTASGDKGTSYGLYQLHGERLTGAQKYFNLPAGQMPTADQQNEYAAWELSPQGPKAAVGAALLKAQTPAEAAAIWTRSYGVPADKTEIGRRAAGAGRYMGLYGQPQPPGAPGAPVTAQMPPVGSPGAQALPVPPIPPAQPPGVSGTPLPAGRPTGPPIITDQPAGSATVAGPPGTVTVGQPLPPSPAVPGNVNAIIRGMTDAGANAATLAPGPSTAAPAAPAPAVIAAATPPPAAQPVQPPQFPDVTSGDVTIRHPGSYADFAAKEMVPTPTTEDFNPNLTPAQQAAFAAKARDLQLKGQQLATLPPAEQAKAAMELTASRATLEAEQQNAIAAKAQAAAAAKTKFDDTQRAAVQTRYDAALGTYNDAAKSKFGFNQDIVKAQSGKQGDFNNKILEPYQNGATQAQQILPNIDLAKQVVRGLPANAAPYLDSEAVRGRLGALERFMPANWKEAVQSADAFQQVMGGLIGQMGGNVVSGQPGGRESAYDQFKSQLPVLAQSQEGRERALIFMEQLAQRRIAENTFMQNYAMDPKNRDPELKVANMSGALPAMNAALGPMVRMPPSRYDPNVAGNTPEGRAQNETYLNYFRKGVKPGESYITYGQDDQGRAHPVVRVKREGQINPDRVED